MSRDGDPAVPSAMALNEHGPEPNLSWRQVVFQDRAGTELMPKVLVLIFFRFCSAFVYNVLANPLHRVVRQNNSFPA